jgi:acyl-CoA thioester hydrolase
MTSESSETRTKLPSKTDFKYFLPITTRWSDNDIFGHVNNVIYYSYFDTIVNQYLIEQGGFDPKTSQQIGYIVQSSCQYLSAISYPEKVLGGFSVNRIGNSSVEYAVAIFKDNEQLAAYGTMTHVFVDKETEKPMPVNEQIRNALTRALVS